MAGSKRPASLYEVLLYTACRNVLVSGFEGDDRLAGALAALESTAESITDADETYKSNLATLNEKKKNGQMDSRTYLYKKYGLILGALRLRGKLDAAETAVDDDSEDFLTPGL